MSQGRKSMKTDGKRASSPGSDFKKTPTGGKSPMAKGGGEKGKEKGKGKGKGKTRAIVAVDFDLAPARPEDPQRTAREIEFLGTVDAKSAATMAKKVIDILSPAASGQEVQVVRASCLALLRLMQEEQGLFAVVNASAFECLHAVKETVLKDEDECPPVFEKEVQVVRDEAGKKAAAFLENVDHVDFHELPKVMLLVGKLHRDSELVCRKGFATLMRFASYDTAHRQEMLFGGMMTVLSFVLKNFIEPELLRQTLLFLCRLSASPFGKEAAGLVLADAPIPDSDHVGLLQTVITIMEDRPGDIGLQLNGFRLLTVWARASVDLRQEVLSSGAPQLLRTTHKMLSDAGLDHMGSWLWAIAGRTLEEDVSAEPAFLQADTKQAAEDPGKKASKGSSSRKSDAGKSRKSMK